MNRTVTAAALAAALLTAACAQGPDAIAAIPMGNAYAGASCAQAAADLAVARQNVATLSKAQQGAATNDAISVLILGVPTSGLFGSNKAGELGAEKGRVMALEARMGAC